MKLLDKIKKIGFTLNLVTVFKLLFGKREKKQEQQNKTCLECKSYLECSDTYHSLKICDDFDDKYSN